MCTPLLAFIFLALSDDRSQRALMDKSQLWHTPFGLRSTAPPMSTMQLLDAAAAREWRSVVHDLMVAGSSGTSLPNSGGSASC